MLALLGVHARQLGGRRRLARALQPDQHDDRRRVRRRGQPVPAAPEQLDELVVDDLDDLLGRRERLEDVLADGLAPCTRSMKARTTLKLTSASRSATRTSRSASWMFSSVRRPRPPSRSKIRCSRVLRESSMETLDSTERRGGFQLDPRPSGGPRDYSAARFICLMTPAGSGGPKTAEPATRTRRRGRPAGAACSTFTPPSTETSTGAGAQRACGSGGSWDRRRDEAAGRRSPGSPT